ncbi:MAG: CoA pyrophosphatase [Acetobacteraceae bacterium]
MPNCAPRLARLAADGRGSSDTAAILAAQNDGWDPGDMPLVPAAVLVPIIHGPAPGVLLTLRTATLSSHAGQVAFPGGRMDPGESAEQTALREAEEEVGLPADRIELVGRLSDHVTGTGYRVTPVVGLLAPGFAPVPAAAEVECVFELPLAVLLDPAAPQRRERDYKGGKRAFWVWPHAEHYIWGATAAILVQLAQRLREEGTG